MKLGDELVKKLQQVFQPSTMVEMRFKEKDIAVKTNADGAAVLLFIGKKNEQGVIKGSRYARTLKTDREGKVIKDHWEEKGKAT